MEVLAYFAGGFVAGLSAAVIFGVGLWRTRLAKRIHRIAHARLAAKLDPLDSPIERHRHRVDERAEAADRWKAAFQAAEPPINLGTPEGLAAAEEALALEKLPHYRRRELGLE